MKKLRNIFILSIVPIFIGASIHYKQTPTVQPINLEPKPIEPILIVEPVIEIENLVDALIQVESGGNDSAIGDTHLGSNHAVGVLQIRPIMVREVNRILKLKGESHRFKMKDRYDREKSIQMFLI